MRAGDRFHRGFAEIEGLYRGTLFAYHRVLASVGANDAGETPAAETPFHWAVQGFEATDVAESIPDLRRKLQGEYPERLREVLFVRAISIFEAFLLDVVREVFTLRQDLFQRDDEVSVSLGFLLSHDRSSLATWIINRDLRALSSGGLRRIQSYYLKAFTIDLTRTPAGWSIITELVDRRHLLVHRLGHTDPKYRRDYAVEAKHVTIGRTYFADSISALVETARWVECLAEECIGRVKLGPAITPSLALAELRVHPRTRAGKAALLPKFAFESDEDVVVLGDILVGSQTGGETRILHLEGSIAQLSSYRSILIWLVRRRDIAPFEFRLLRRPKRGKAGFPRGVLEFVEAALPEDGVVPEGFKRRSAEQLGVQPVIVSQAISYFQFSPSDEELVRYADWLNRREMSSGIHLELASRFAINPRHAHRAIDVARAAGLLREFPQEGSASTVGDA